MLRTLALASLFAASLAACATQDAAKAQPASDELAGEAGDGDAAKADSPHDTFGFLSVVKDGAFQCENPLTCTPYTLRRANRSTIKCNDGEYHASCTVKALEWDAAGLSADQADQVEAALQRSAEDSTLGVQVLVKGTFKVYVDFLAFEPSEVWVAQLPGGDSTGTFVQVHDNETLLACQPERPCPQYTEFKLNSSKSASIEALDIGSDASDAVQDKVAEATAGASGAIVVGGRETRSRVDYVDSLRAVDQVYLPVK